MTEPKTRQHKMLGYVFVFLGGALGSLLRANLSHPLLGFDELTTTFGINILACFLLGWAMAAQHRLYPHLLTLLTIGFCGGLSTFSSLIADLFHIAGTGLFPVIRAALYELIFGLLAVWAGSKLGTYLHGLEDG